MNQAATPAPSKETAPGQIERAESVVLILTAILSGLSLAFLGLAKSLGVAVGGVLAYGNLRVLRLLVQGFFVKPAEAQSVTKSHKRKMIALALGKFVLFYGGVWFLMAKTHLDRVGFLIGFSTLVLALLTQGIGGAARVSPESPAVPGKAA